MQPPRNLLTVACSLCLLIGSGLFAQEWTRFRGPNGAGLGEAAGVPLKWTEKDFNWKVRLPDVGHSSPVLWGERIFLTSGDKKAGRLTVLCLHASDGRALWKQKLAVKPYKMHLKNSIATATPAVDGERVYVCWGTPKECIVMALDHAGKTLWQADLGGYPSQHGFGVSPIVHDGLVVVNYQPDGDGALVALDVQSGKVRWKTPRKGKNATYSTPCVLQLPGRPAELIFTNWQHGITGVDPATGKVAWETHAFDTETQQRAIGSPVVAGELVLGGAGFISAKTHNGRPAGQRGQGADGAGGLARRAGRAADGDSAGQGGARVSLHRARDGELAAGGQRQSDLVQADGRRVRRLAGLRRRADLLRVRRRQGLRPGRLGPI